LKDANVYDIEDVHRLLDGIEATIADLKEQSRPDIDVLQDAGELCLAITEIMGWVGAPHTRKTHFYLTSIRLCLTSSQK
jgi:hypothetical protein